MKSIAGAILVLGSILINIARAILSVFDMNTYNYIPIYNSEMFKFLGGFSLIIGIMLILIDNLTIFEKIINNIKKTK